MKKVIFLMPALLCILLQACSDAAANGGHDAAARQYNPPAAGNIVCQSVIPVKEDTLNNFNFSVKIKTTATSTSKGTYSIEAEWGYNIANGEFTMPEGLEHQKPVIHKGTEPYTYIIGFNYGKDNAFYDYYLVSGGKTSMVMKYIKAYSFK